MHVRVDDMVEVITGDDKGQRGKVLAIDRQAGKVLVEGVNRVYKHVRRSQKNPQGGRLSKEMPVRISNIQLVCRACGKSARMGMRLAKSGVKQRFCKKCSADNGDISPARTARASRS